MGGVQVLQAVRGQLTSKKWLRDSGFKLSPNYANVTLLYNFIWLSHYCKGKFCGWCKLKVVLTLFPAITLILSPIMLQSPKAVNIIKYNDRTKLLLQQYCEDTNDDCLLYSYSSIK